MLPLRGAFTVIVSLLAMTPLAFAASQPIDADTGLPMDDVWRVATRSECIGFAHCSEVCIELAVDRGKLGRLSWLHSVSQYRVEYYRAGYYDISVRPEEPRLSRKAPPYLSGRADVIDARIEYLGSLAIKAACIGPAGKDFGKVAGFVQDLLSEGAALAVLPEHKQDLQSRLCIDLVRAAGTSPAGVCTERLDWRERDETLVAVRAGDRETVERLLAGPMRAEKTARRLNPALIDAVQRGDVAALRLLLQVHADPNVQDPRFGPRPLLTVLAQHSHHDPSLKALQLPVKDETAREMAFVLLEGGADPNRYGPTGVAPIHDAVDASNGELLAVLIAHGANVDLPLKQSIGRGSRPLHLARNAAIAQQLLDAGAQVDARNQLGQTPLANLPDPQTAALLLQYGANPNAPFGNDWTPLMACLQRYESWRHQSAVASRYRELARVLVAHGADLARRNSLGNDAFFFTSDPQIKTELERLATSQGLAPNGVP